MQRLSPWVGLPSIVLTLLFFWATPVLAAGGSYGPTDAVGYTGTWASTETTIVVDSTTACSVDHKLGPGYESGTFAGDIGGPCTFTWTGLTAGTGYTLSILGEVSEDAMTTDAAAPGEPGEQSITASSTDALSGGLSNAMAIFFAGVIAGAIFAAAYLVTRWGLRWVLRTMRGSYY